MSLRNKFYYFPLLIVPFTVVLFSCGGGSDDDVNGSDSTKTIDTTTQSQRINTQNVFYNIPSPVETSTLLLDAGAEYDQEMVNDPTIFKSYVSEEDRAINLGVYGADLSFCGVLENSAESMSFLKAVNGICKALGISGVFDDKTADRLEKNRNNRDSILDIVQKSFWEADEYLKENQRPNTSSLIVAGGWVEGMFIAGKVYEKTKSEKIRNRLTCAPQKSSLTSLIALLEASKQNSNSQYLLDDLKKLKVVYDKIPESKQSSTATTDPKTGVTTIGTTEKVKVDETVVTEITKAISDLRTRMVTPK